MANINLSNDGMVRNEAARAQFVIQEICAEFHTNITAIISRQRSQRRLPPRVALAAALREFTCLSLIDIGNIMNRDHSTVMHSLKIANNSAWLTPMLKRIEKKLAVLKGPAIECSTWEDAL